AVVHGQRDKISRLIEHGAFRRDHHALERSQGKFLHNASEEVRRQKSEVRMRRTQILASDFCVLASLFRYFTSPAIRLACSAASSMPPTYRNAPSGNWSHLPSQISWKLR